MTKIKTGAVEVHGLVELNRALKAIGPETKGELRKTNKTVADLVANTAQGSARSLGSTPAHVAPSLKPTAGALSAGVSMGGPRFPMAAGAEFGSDKYKQFKPWRGRGEGAGYFLWPAIRSEADRIETEYARSMDELLRKVNLK